MKKLLLPSLIILFTTYTQAQNLVTNPGFENYSVCPSTDGEITDATGWTDPTGTGPDYYNSCADVSTGYSVPYNNSGTRSPHGGNAYAGIITYIGVPGFYELREYMQGQLTAPLAADSIYNVSFYVARGGVADYAASTIGAYFSEFPVHPPQNTSGSIIPQVVNPGSNVIIDTLNWTLVSGSFTATGVEQYITIGNFNKAATSNPQFQGGSGNYSAYYYIDDVSVTKDVTTGNPKFNNASSVSIYFDPSEKLLNINIKGYSTTEQLQLALYDYTGRLVLTSPLVYSMQKVSTENVPAGAYICRISGSEEILSKLIYIRK